MIRSASGETLVVGTRGSQLARAQTQWVLDRLQACYPDLSIQTEIISTAGDRQRIKPLPEIGGKGLFTEDLERALLAGSIDLAVHSAKDLPTRLTEGLEVLAYPAREDPRDAWISADGRWFDELPDGSTVGTSSLRRQAQLLMHRKDLTFIGLRGNVDTRIKKVHRGDCAGAVLAMAGLIRTGLTQHVTHPFEPAICLPAPGQGALALEGRCGDDRIREYLQVIHDELTATAVECERAVLKELDAGCRAPVAVYARVVEDELQCEALVSDPRGERFIRVEASYSPSQPDMVVQQIVDELRLQRADDIIAECRQ
ncbi:MAG: hydroxymethylbilane synthase [Planctomycetota bacterium]|nr:MAG: hydroxymethylbilane synthase [Planctomycetota bacterium]